VERDLLPLPDELELENNTSFRLTRVGFFATGPGLEVHQFVLIDVDERDETVMDEDWRVRAAWPRDGSD
jgi:hypothetical protein